jgi:hypothetical protein
MVTFEVSLRRTVLYALTFLTFLYYGKVLDTGVTGSHLLRREGECLTKPPRLNRIVEKYLVFVRSVRSGCCMAVRTSDLKSERDFSKEKYTTQCKIQLGGNPV